MSKRSPSQRIGNGRRAQGPPRRSITTEPTDEQINLLARMRRRPLVLTGEETDEERLGLLQLYAGGLVIHSTNRKRLNAMEWQLTATGRTAVRASQHRRSCETDLAITIPQMRGR